MLQADRCGLTDDYVLSAWSKMLAQKKIRRTSGSRAALGACRRQIGLTDAGLVIGSLTLDRCMVRITTAAALLHAAGHPANIRRLRCKRDWRRNGSNQQGKRRTKGAQAC